MNAPAPFLRSISVSAQIRHGALRLLALPLLYSAFSPGQLFGQQSSAKEESAEETIVLSPFQVTSSEDRGYVWNRSTPIPQPNFHSSNGGGAPGSPITMIRSAEAVVIEFALSNSADKQDLRNQQLTDSADLVAKAIRAIPGLRFENREVQLASGNRQRSIIGKGEAVTSFANFAVFAELNPEMRLYERVKQVRSLVSAATLSGGTKVIDGPVALFLRRPNEYRKELLTKIFEDLETVKKGLGSDFEVLVNGLSGPIQLRGCSENEIEMWIDYTFTIRSVRELTARISDRK